MSECGATTGVHSEIGIDGFFEEVSLIDRKGLKHI
jgi:hypothetical protein